MLHFKHRPSMTDEELYEKGYNRVYDTLELEQNLDDAEKISRAGARRAARRHACSRADVITEAPRPLPRDGTPRAARS